MALAIVLASLSGTALLWLVFLRRYGNGPCKYKIREPGIYDYEYQPTVIKVPPIRGFLLRLASRICSSWFGHAILSSILSNESGVRRFRTYKIVDNPTFYPSVPFDGEPAKVGKKDFSNAEVEKLLEKDFKRDGFNFNSMSAYLHLYKTGELTPTMLAERAIRAIEETTKINAIVKYNLDSVRKMAAESTERYKNNATLSPVDGVIVVVKDEFAMKGFVYSCGTSFLGQDKENINHESNVVTELRKLGVIILGIANMHELGLGTTGNNCNKGFGTCRNPYNIGHYTGGSSSGCASAVAAGLCSFGLGSDGGGSIRIPASYCGVVGLKPTFARINLTDVHGLSNSVGHAGPICTNVRDAAVFYSLLSGPHRGYQFGMNQPKIILPDFQGNLDGIKVGIDWRYFKDCRPDVYDVCKRSLDHLTASGAILETVEIPELSDVILAHRITILAEMSSSINYSFDFNFDDLTRASQMLFKLGQCISALDYLQANKQRTRIISFLRGLFEDVDAIVMPTTGHCAPEIHPSELSDGMLNGSQDNFNMRYAGLGNLTGCPAISIPVGYNASGLPVGLQLMGAWWKEHVILKIAEAVEQRVVLNRPTVYADLLDM